MYQSKKELDRLKQEIEPSRKLIRIRDVMHLTGISKSYIYQLCNNDQFPKSIQLVPGGSAVAWKESEILDWIDERVSNRDVEGAA